MRKPEENVINFYCLCNKLKTLIRTGWKVWNVSSNRLESVAEHIYGTQMLAIAMKSEYNYDIDIEKVLYMLAIHELGEIVIGDITLFDMNSEMKKSIELDAVSKILEDLLDGEAINKLFLEFDNHETKEGMFAYECDKLEADIQAKLYENYVDVNDQENNNSFSNKTVRELLEKGETFGEMWLDFHRMIEPYDDNFKAVSLYARNNDIGEDND